LHQKAAKLREIPYDGKTEISPESLSEIGDQMPQGVVVEVDHTKLKISFHGRIIDHLGIQMYQSPVAAIAEIISNSWDAEAEKVDVLLPGLLGPTATFKISDNGNGMTFDQCQERFLAVGRNRRVNEADVTTEKQRPILINRQQVQICIRALSLR
jgi:hypothetical protein